MHFCRVFLSTAIKTGKEGKERGERETERGDGGHVGCLHWHVRADVGVHEARCLSQQARESVVLQGICVPFHGGDVALGGVAE